jgi:hypothetical protein
MKKYFGISVLGIGLLVLCAHSANAQWVQTSDDWDVYELVVSGGAIFAGTAGNGVEYSTDNGTNWMSADSSLTDGDVYAMAVSGSTVIAGTWRGVYL